MEILNGATGTSFNEKERILTRELNELVLAEESFFKQKSRVQWL